jgi:hypothetical protein
VCFGLLWTNVADKIGVGDLAARGSFYSVGKGVFWAETMR